MTLSAASSTAGRLRSIAFLAVATLCIVPILAQTNESHSGAKIASVTPISPKGWQTIVIEGARFGTNPPINGCPDHLRVTDVTTNWSVPAVGPFGGCQAGIFVSSWNDNEIVIEGFPSFQRGQDAFKIGDVIKIEVSNAQQGGPTSWYSVRVAPQGMRAPAPPARAPISIQSSPPLTLPAGSQVTSDQPSSTSARVVRAVIREGATSLELPQGQMHLYGMTTGGGAPSSGFVTGQYAQVVNAAGKLSGALAYGTNSQNSYSTRTAYHDIGGVSVSGSWENFTAYHGSNPQTGAHDASVSFQANEDSLVVLLGLASSQQFVSVEGIPNLQVDASRNGGGMVIAHAYVKPGTYNVIEQSKVLAAGQDPSHMTNLVGVFVFAGKQANTQPAVIPEQSHAADIRGGVGKGNIRSVDFQNFSYESNCSEKVDAGFGKIIPATNGSWKKGSLETEDSLGFSVVKVFYGDVKGDGQVEAVVHTACLPPANWDYEELSVFEMSGGAPRLLARLTPGEGLADHGPRYDVVKADGGELSVSYQVTGEHGSGACPEWTVTERFRWNGSRFVSKGQSRRKNGCAP